MGMKGQILDNFVRNAIKNAENELQNLNILPQQEEYESLVLGSSIWSTDVRRETKHEFIEGIKNNRSTSDFGMKE